MTTPCNINGPQVSQFKQEVFTRLAFLGMPHGDAGSLRHLWKFVNLSVKLVTDEGDQSLKSEKLVRALSRELGSSRALLFLRWFGDKIKLYFGKEFAVPTPNPSDAGEAGPPPADIGCTAVVDTKAESAVGDTVHTHPKSVGAIAGAEPMCEPAVSGTVLLHPNLKPLQTLSVPVSCSSSISPGECGDEAWVEVKASEGKKYYWDRSSNACMWALPSGIKPMWTSHKSPDGRTYYSDCSGKSFWVMPPLRKSSTSTELCISSETTGEAAAPPLYVPDVGIVVPVSSLPAAKHPVPADLGPFQEVFPEQRKLEASMEHGHEVTQTIVPANQCSEDSSDVSNLRSELAELRKQLAALSEEQPSSADAPASRKINDQNDSLEEPDSPTEPHSRTLDEPPVEEKPLRRKRSAATSRSNSKASGKDWDVWSNRLRIACQPELPEERRITDRTVAAAANVPSVADNCHMSSGADSDVDSDVTADTELSSGEVISAPGPKTKLLKRESTASLSKRSNSCSSREQSDKKELSSALRHLQKGVAALRERSRSRSICSTSSRGEAGCLKTNHTKDGLDEKTMLDKFLTAVRHGKPPGNWEKSPSQSWIKESVFEHGPSRRASRGGA